MNHNVNADFARRLLLIAGLLLAVTGMTACPEEKSNKQSKSNNASLPSASKSPTPGPVIALTPETLRARHAGIVGSQKVAFEPLTFTIPDTPPDTLFDIVDLDAYSQRGGLGGPRGNLTDEQRAELRSFVNDNMGNASGTVYINGDNVTEGKDLQTQIAILSAEQDAAVQWVRNAFQLRKEIEGLAKFKWRPGGPLPSADVPDGLKNYLRSEFERMKNTLPAEQQSPLANWKVDFGMPPSPDAGGESLWLKTGENVIWMSPIMLRALLLEAVGKELISDYPTLLRTRLRGGSSRSVYEQLGKPTVINAVLEKFRSSLLFLLAHRMAHVYVLTAPAASALERETIYDEAAIRLSGSPARSLDALRGLLEKTDSSTGFEEAGDTETVLSRLGG